MSDAFVPTPAATITNVPTPASASQVAPITAPATPPAQPAAQPAAPAAAAPNAAPAAQPPASPPSAAAQPPATPPAQPPRNPYARAAAPPDAARRVQEASRVAELETRIAERDAAFGVFVDAELAALPPPMQAAVREGAGTDVAARMRMIAALKKNGAIAAAPVGIPSTTTAPQPVNAPGAAVTADPDVAALAHHEKLVKANLHTAASEFMLQNRQAIARARQKRAS